MPIIPAIHSINSVSHVMSNSLQELQKIIEKQCDHSHPKEILVLMIGFINSLILQLRDKVETVEKGFGNEFLKSVHEITQSDPALRNLLDQINKEDPALNESPSGLLQEDRVGGIHYLAEKMLNDIRVHIKELPVLLRNDEIVLHSFSVIIALILKTIDNRNFEENIETFVSNIRLHAGQINEDPVIH